MHAACQCHFLLHFCCVLSQLGSMKFVLRLLACKCQCSTLCDVFRTTWCFRGCMRIVDCTITVYCPCSLNTSCLAWVHKNWWRHCILSYIYKCTGFGGRVSLNSFLKPQALLLLLWLGFALTLFLPKTLHCWCCFLQRTVSFKLVRKKSGHCAIREPTLCKWH